MFPAIIHTMQLPIFFPKRIKLCFDPLEKKQHLKQMKQKYKLFIIFSSLSAPVCHKQVC